MRVKLKPLAEQVIVITGASSGIGLATAKAAAKQGAKVVLAARNGEALAEVEASIRDAGGEAIHVVTDVAEREQLEALATAAIEKYGRFDTWVNNAGVSIFGELEKVSEEDHRRLFDVNFWGLVNGTLVAAEHLKASPGGAIINLGSVVSDVGFPIQGMYAASKHAVKGFTDAYRMELKREGAPISLTLIKPASIETPFTLHAKNEMENAPRLPEPVYLPEDVASAILHAAVYGGREYYVGGGGKLMSSLNKHVPGLVDWMGAHVIPALSAKNEPNGRDREGALHEPGEDGSTRGDGDQFVRSSIYTKAAESPMLTGAALAAVGLGAVGFLVRNNFGRR